MNKKKIMNMVLAVVFLGLTLVLPVRGLISNRDYAKEAKAKGIVVFNDNTMNSGAKNMHYIMLFLFGSLTLVFGFRAFKKENEQIKIETNPE